MFKILNENMVQFDCRVASIDAWYDRHTRDYCIQLLNKDGYQIGDAIRCGDKKSKDAIVKEFKEKYKI